MKSKELYVRFPQGRVKALTFSYDDDVVFDKRLVEILDSHGMKGTFNLNSGCFRPEGDPGKRMISEAEAKELFANGRHEIAVHTLTHPNLVQLKDDDEVVRQINQDRDNLERISGQKIVGMAYPCGGINNDERVGNLIKRFTEIKYSRTITSSYTCDIQTDLIHFNPTVHHSDTKLPEIFEKFMNLNNDKLQILYIWGHAFELDRGTSMSWSQFDDLCRMLSNRKDVYYGTNREVLLGE